MYSYSSPTDDHMNTSNLVNEEALSSLESGSNDNVSPMAKNVPAGKE